MSQLTAAEIEARLDSFFEENLKLVQLESGYRLSPESQNVARWQARLYWRRLREIAERVTDTEVKLSLPEQMTPRTKVKFGIEGIVDIVRENDRVVMYDLKTHEASYIRENKELYRQQLNVYAYIWKNLRGEPLDETAIICTTFPPEWKGILQDEARLAPALAAWEPVIDLDFAPDEAANTIRHFAEIVERIEAGEFAPAPVSQLKEHVPGTNSVFGRYVCRNCDARFSCSSYREYALGSSAPTERKFLDYYNDLGAEADREDFIDAALELSPTLADPDEFRD